jgi:hypothetical protein
MIITGGVTFDGGLTFIGAVPNPSTFSTAGTYYFVVPADVTSITVTAVGSGGGGAGGSASWSAPNWSYTNGGGGQGGNVVSDTLSVTTGQVYEIIIPSGGAGGLPGYVYNGVVYAIPQPGDNGSNTVVKFNGSAVVTAAGGYGGARPSNDIQTGGGRGGPTTPPYAGGENKVIGGSIFPLAPGAANTDLGIPVSGGGSGGGGPGGSNNPGSGGSGSAGNASSTPPGDPGYAGYVHITW